jgi:small subunit ribosomal protein S8
MMTDPIADMLTRIRNGTIAKKESISIPYSKIKEAIISIIVEEGYIASHEIGGEGVEKKITVHLKYIQQKSIINELRRVSKPGGRIYVDFDNIPKVMSGYGVAILSTSKGIVSDRKARELHIGGEVLCSVS